MAILQERRNQQQNNQGETLPMGSVTDIELCPTPIHGALDGEAVRIIALGNVKGFSPGYLVVDESGQSDWVPVKQVRVTDPNFLPLDSRNFKNQK